MSNTSHFCYWCGELATYKEHVPPKCLFPEEKDVKGIYDKKFRNNLITVPSCDEHNLGKSQDDECLMLCISPYVGNNGVAYIHANTEVKQAIGRNRGLYSIVDHKTIVVNNLILPTMIVEVDTNRLINSFEAIGSALYFYSYKKQVTDICKIIPTFLRDKEQNTDWNHLCDLCIELVKLERCNWAIHGENPEVFMYQFGEEEIA
jgi:hypothetical protein